MQKVYQVEFMRYTNCLNDTVSTYVDSIPYNTQNVKYLNIGKDPFLVKESDLDKYIQYGCGYRNIIFVGYIDD